MHQIAARAPFWTQKCARLQRECFFCMPQQPSTGTWTMPTGIHISLKNTHKTNNFTPLGTKNTYFQQQNAQKKTLIFSRFLGRPGFTPRHPVFEPFPSYKRSSRKKHSPPLVRHGGVGGEVRGAGLGWRLAGGWLLAGRQAAGGWLVGQAAGWWHGGGWWLADGSGWHGCMEGINRFRLLLLLLFYFYFYDE